MRDQEFPEDSSGTVEGTDGPVRRTRAHVLGGFSESRETASHGAGRNQAYIDEEGAWLDGRFLE